MSESLESMLSRLDSQLRRLASRSSCHDVRHNPDDLIQDLWLRLHRHSVPTNANKHAYAVKAFQNLIKDRERSYSRRRNHDVAFRRSCQKAQEITSRCTMGDLSDRNYIAPRRARQTELRQHLKRAIRMANLSSDHRCALWAWLRNSLSEFAKKRGIPRSTASVWALRAREALRPHFKHPVF